MFLIQPVTEERLVFEEYKNNFFWLHYGILGRQREYSGISHFVSWLYPQPKSAALLSYCADKKKSFILVPFLGGEFAGGESAWWRGNWIPLLHSNWPHLLQHLIDPSFLGKIGLQH